jgi:hypothetical protein
MGDLLKVVRLPDNSCDKSYYSHLLITVGHHYSSGGYQIS